MKESTLQIQIAICTIILEKHSKMITKDNRIYNHDLYPAVRSILNHQYSDMQIGIAFSLMGFQTQIAWKKGEKFVYRQLPACYYEIFQDKLERLKSAANKNAENTAQAQLDDQEPQTADGIAKPKSAANELPAPTVTSKPSIPENSKTEPASKVPTHITDKITAVANAVGGTDKIDCIDFITIKMRG